VSTARAECSAKTQKGVKTVFDEAIRAKMEKDSEAIMYTEIINDIDDMADAVQLAQEAGLVVSAGVTLDALKARLGGGRGGGCTGASEAEAPAVSRSGGARGRRGRIHGREGRPPPGLRRRGWVLPRRLRRRRNGGFSLRLL
jgi:hypothetical protein